MLQRMRGYLESPRRRKRVAVLAVVVLVAGAGAIVGLTWSNTSHEKETFEPGKAQVIQKQVPVVLSVADRRAALRALGRFVEAAIARRNLAAAYDLATPELRGPVSRREWARGDISVPSYPVYRYGARITDSYRNDVSVQLFLKARRRSVEPLGVDVELKAVGRGANRRWLVAYYLPRQTLGTAVAQSPKAASGQEDPGLGPHLGKVWFFVPLALLGLIVFVPVGLGVRDWLQGRAAERRYGERRELPPLPPRTGRR
jgi:hypothetical protein